MYYYVQSGDSMHSIAQAYNTTVSDLMDLNPQIRNPHRIHVGERIKVSSGDHWGHNKWGGNNEWGSNQWYGNDHHKGHAEFQRGKEEFRRGQAEFQRGREEYSKHRGW